MSNPASLSLREYFHAPAIAAGFAAVLIGYSGSAVIVFQAAKAAGADSLQISSWMMVLGIGLGLTSIGLSWRYKMPIITAWSTPGAALLATSLGDIGMPEAIGAFLFSGALITLCGVSGWFERIIDRIPLALAAAMLAGILFQFGVDAFTSMESQLGLVLAMFVVYLLLGIFSGAIASLFAAFPGEFVFALAGLALLSTIANSLYTAVSDDASREAAVITFVVTASGLSLFGIGAAFWGLVAGVVASLVLSKKKS